jgi:hypothetical protein
MKNQLMKPLLTKDTNREKSTTDSEPPFLYLTINCFDSKGCFKPALCAFKACIFMADDDTPRELGKFCVPKTTLGIAAAGGTSPDILICSEAGTILR